MRCKNCGYINEDGVERCIKCNANLRGSMASKQQDNIVQEAAATLKEPQISNEPRFVQERGHRRRPEPEMRPSPSYEVIGEGTVNPWRMKSQGLVAFLEPLDNGSSDNSAYGAIELMGEQIPLVRSNTNPHDATISSSQQAIITNVDGEWYIEDQSKYQTTCIIVQKKLKLEQGDIIVLGSSRFKFSLEDPRHQS